MSLNNTTEIQWTWFDLTFNESTTLYESKYESAVIGTISTIALFCVLIFYFLEIIKKSKGKLIDSYVILDCALRFFLIPDIWDITGILPNNFFCESRTVAVMLIHSSSKIITFSIALIRWVYVAWPFVTYYPYKKRLFHISLIAGGLGLLAIIGFESALNVDRIFFYHACEGDVLNFLKHREHSGLAFDVPSYHPLKAVSMLVFHLNTFLTPILYISIFNRMKNTYSTSLGLDENSLSRRKQKNVVSAKVNFLNWIIENMIFIVKIATVKGSSQ